MVTIKRTTYADVLRILACISVIFIHTSNITVINMNLFNSERWWNSNIYFSITRWSVPVFIMISGMFLLKRDEEYITLFKNRILKLVILLFIWGYLYKLWDAILNKGKFSFTKATIEIINGNAYSHLWYIYMLIGIYLLIPIFRVYVKNADDKNIKYFLILWFVFNGVVSILNKFLNLNIGFKVPVVMNLSGYFIAGYYLNKVDVQAVKRYIFYILGAISLYITIYGSFYLNVDKKSLDQYFYDNQSFTTIIVSFAIFILFKHISFQDVNEKVKKIIVQISSYCFGIYLIHLMVLTTLLVVLSRKAKYLDILSRHIDTTIIAFSVFIISLIIVYIMKKIPILKKLL